MTEWLHFAYLLEVAAKIVRVSWGIYLSLPGIEASQMVLAKDTTRQFNKCQKSSSGSLHKSKTCL